MSVQAPTFEKAESKRSKVTVRVEEVVGPGFDVKKFVENFGVLASAPGGVERLRAMTLHLAIRGALTNERRLGPPASVTSGLNPPFELPPGWAWRQVNEVGDLKLGRQRAPSNHTGPNMRPYLRVANVHEARIDISHVLEMNFEPEEAERFLLVAGDVLLNEGQSYELVGRPAIYGGEVPGACFQNTLIRFRPWQQTVLSAFALVVFRAYMRTGRFRQEAQQTTNIAHLSAGRLAVIEFPLPPLAEQKRIVAKVEQLMALCDDLEARQTKKRETGIRLTKSALEALPAAEGPEDFDAAWKRVVENFDVLIDRPAKVADLRVSILALAASGRICSPSRAPAPSVPQGDTYEPEFAVPSGWTWSSLGALCKFIDYRGRTPTKTSKGVRLVTAKNVRMGVLRDEPREYIAESDYETWMTRGFPKIGDVLFTTEAPLGNVAQLLTTEKVALAQRIITFQPVAAVNPAFLMTLLMSPQLQASIAGKATGMTALGIKAAKLKLIPFPVPPLDEQARVVARVEQLMKVCDDLEAKLRRAEDRAAKLVEAVVQELVA